MLAVEHPGKGQSRSPLITKLVPFIDELILISFCVDFTLKKSFGGFPEALQHVFGDTLVFFLFLGLPCL